MSLPPTPFDEQLIVRYLLGELTEEQQIEIEDRAFQDQEYMQSILAGESDLIDEYVNGEIPNHQRQRFESHFLVPVERRRKVDFAKALATVTGQSALAAAPAVRTEPKPNAQPHYDRSKINLFSPDKNHV